MALDYLICEKKLAGKVDLVYIDPPFATGIEFKVSEGRVSTISSQRNGKVAYSDKTKGADFIEFLRQRLVLLRELLSDRGSIYLHIDYKIGHYVKVMMDEVFGINNFRNDITRIKCNPKNFARVGYGNIKDMVLFYSKGSSPIWNEPIEGYTEADIKRLYAKIGSDGRRYTTVPIHAPGETENAASSQPFKGILPPKGRHWRTDTATLEQWDEQGLIEWSLNGNPRKKIYADESDGKRVQDVWELKDPQYPSYPTEKNMQMLERIVRTSSNEDSIVLDCFCGSGSTLRAANRLERAWIGIDSSELAIEITAGNLALDQNEMLLFGSELSYDFIDLENVAVPH
jgi:adenine-specific DNA-methyltransferase